MREGKLSEPVWKRSVLRKIKNRREEVFLPTGGRAGNSLDITGRNMIVVSEAGFLFSLHTGSDISGKVLLHRAVNACAAMCAEPVAVQIQFVCPTDFMESDLRNLIASLEEEAEKLNISLLPGRMESSSAVNLPYLTLTGIGAGSVSSYEEIKAGQEILMTKWIAIEATALLAEEYKAKLLARFTPVFVHHAQEMLQYISCVPEAAVAVKHGVQAMLPIEEGGIFGALWELADGAGLGLQVQVREIPVRQETIEICELCHKNPYKLPSAGSLLIVTEQGEQLKQKLIANRIPAAVIGRLTEGKERVLLQEAEKRFLDLPEKKEWRDQGEQDEREDFSCNRKEQQN